MEYGRYYSAATADDMVDISSSSFKSGSEGSDGSYNGGNDDGGNKKTKIIIIASAAAALVIIIAVILLCVNLSGGSDPKKTDNTPMLFEFADNTKISGIDVSGKTVKEAKELLEKNKKSFIKPITISVKVGDDTAKLTQDDFEYEYNIDEVLNNAKNDSKNGGSSGKEYTVTATPTDSSITNKSVEFCENHYTDAKNAYVSAFHPYSEKRFEFEEAKNGLCVDKDDLKKQIGEAFKSGKAESELTPFTEEIPAKVTADYLKKHIVKLSSYETYSSNTANGTQNMKISLEACNGSVIDPDEIWSFNDCTGDSNLASNGYLPANVIVDGKIEQGNGGGICQSSSTIYNAAIRANMVIVERSPHQWASLYVPTGLDATIDYPNLDLKLQNGSEYQMFLECKLVDYTLYATFWGVKSPDYDEIKTRNELGESSDKSYHVRAWRVYYKDGKKTGEEELPSSDYDLENGLNFYAADNDAGAVDTNVDNLSDTSDNGTPNAAETYNSDAQSDTPEETPTEAPYTETPQETEIQQTELPQEQPETPI